MNKRGIQDSVKELSAHKFGVKLRAAGGYAWRQQGEARRFRPRRLPKASSPPMLGGACNAPVRASCAMSAIVLTTP